MQEPRQHDLIPIEETLGSAPEIEQHESAGRYTAARLKQQKPELARAALALLGAGYGLQDTADTLGLHFYSVQAIASEAPAAVAVGKKQTARLAGHVGRTALEKIKDYLEDCTITTPQHAQQLATVAGIALDKAQVLDGEPTEITQVQAPALVDVGGLMSKLLPAQPVSAGENSAVKEAAAVAIVPGGLVAASRRVLAREAEEKADKDLQVVDVQCSEAAKHETNNQLQADPGAGEVIEADQAGADRGPADAGTAPGARSEGTGGGVASSRPSSHTNASDSQNFFEQRD